MGKKILIIAGGKKSKLDLFKEPAERLGLDVTLASFSELSYSSDTPFILKINDQDVSKFDVIYVRVVGKRVEDLTLLVAYAKEKGIRVVDKLYEEAHLLPLSLGKSIETMKLVQANVAVPESFFGALDEVIDKAKAKFGFPFVIKSTTGKKAREVWSPQNDEDLSVIREKIKVLDPSSNMRFFSQEFISASQRLRAFVIGDRVVSVITRPTKWRKRFIEKVGEEFPEGEKKALDPIPEADAKMALDASKAVSLEIAGVDIVHDDKTGKVYVLEVNSAPSWELVRKDAKMNVEEEILKYLCKVKK